MAGKKTGGKGKGKGTQQPKSNAAAMQQHKTASKPQKSSVKQGVSPGQASKSAAARYAATLLAPCSGNSRIPDMCCIDTFLSTVDFEFSITINSAGVGGALFTVYNASTTAVTYSVEDATSTDAAFVYASPAIPLTGFSSLGAACSASRPVSACVDLMYTGSSNNDSGFIVGASRGIQEVDTLGMTSLTVMSNSRSNTTNRIAKGMSVAYRPTDSRSFDFRQSGGTFTYGSLIVHISGATAGSTMRGRYRINFECVPIGDNNDYTTGIVASPVDPVGFSQALNAARALPPTMPIAKAETLTSKMSKVFNAAIEYGPAVYDAVQVGRQAAGLLL